MCVNIHLVTSKKSMFSECVHVLEKKKEEKISYECLGVVFVVLLFASREQGDWVVAHP